MERRLRLRITGGTFLEASRWTTDATDGRGSRRRSGPSMAVLQIAALPVPPRDSSTPCWFEIAQTEVASGCRLAGDRWAAAAVRMPDRPCRCSRRSVGRRWPRKGWLAVFLTDEGAFQVRVLHVDGAVAERQGPGPQSAGWARHVQWKSPRIFHLPQWPVTIEERGGTTLHQPVDSDTVPVDRERRATIQLKLNDPAFLPFNKDTLAYLREKIGAELVKQARTACNLSMTERLRPADRRWFEQQKTIAMQSLQRFFEIEESLQTTSPFDIDRLVEAMTDLIDLPTYEYVYDRDDADGFRELRYRPSKLCDPLSFGRISTRDWWTRFQVELGWHAVVAYTRDPTALHSPARTRFEDEWRAESRGCFAGMGHAPVGHIYTPHGPGTPNEVLLELPTSNLVGWIWGDCYSLVLTIDREDLRRDDFSKMSLDITN